MKTGIVTLCCTSALAPYEIADSIMAAGAMLVGDTAIAEVHVGKCWGTAAPNEGLVDVCISYDGYAWDACVALRRLKPSGVIVCEVHTERLDHGDDC